MEKGRDRWRCYISSLEHNHERGGAEATEALKRAQAGGRSRQRYRAPQPPSAYPCSLSSASSSSANDSHTGAAPLAKRPRRTLNDLLHTLPGQDSSLAIGTPLPTFPSELFAFLTSLLPHRSRKDLDLLQHCLSSASIASVDDLAALLSMAAATVTRFVESLRDEKLDKGVSVHLVKALVEARNELVEKGQVVA